jgi:hypothetical protein
MASETHENERSPEDAAAPARVSTYLGRLEQKRRSARRNRMVALGVGAAVGGVAYLTAIGLAPTEARDLAASAGAIVMGFALSRA